MISYFNDYELDIIYDKVIELRKQVKNNQAAFSYYEKLKEINKGDQLYGWMFTTDDILNDTPENLELYQKTYIHDILIVYKNELENILYKINL